MKLRLRHGRQLALLSCPNLALNLCTLLFLSVTGTSPSSSNFPNCSSPGESASIFAHYLRSHFSVSQSKALRSGAIGFLSELRRATCPEESHSSFCYLFAPAEFIAAASNLSLSTAIGSYKVAYAILKHLFRSEMDLLLHISIFPGLCIPFLPCERHLPLLWSTRWESLSTLLLPYRLSLSPHAPQNFLNAPFHLSTLLSGV